MGARSKAKLALIAEIKRAVANAHPEVYVENIEKAREEDPDEDRKEYHPIVEMALIAANPRNDVDLRHSAHKEVASYLYPKVKTVELESAGGDGLTIQIVNFGSEQQAIEKGATVTGEVVKAAIEEDSDERAGNTH